MNCFFLKQDISSKCFCLVLVYFYISEVVELSYFSHKLVTWFLCLCMMTFWGYVLSMIFFASSTIHMLLQNVLSYTSALYFRSSNMYSVFALSDNLVQVNFILPTNSYISSLVGMLQFSFLFKFLLSVRFFCAIYIFAPEFNIALLLDFSDNIVMLIIYVWLLT